MTKKQWCLLCLCSLFALMIGCGFKGYKLPHLHEAPPKVTLKHRFYLYEVVDVKGVTRRISDQERAAYVRLYPDYFTTDIEKGILLRKKVLEQDFKGSVHFTFVFYLFSLGIIPSYHESNERLLTTFEVIPPEEIATGEKPASDLYPSPRGVEQIIHVVHAGWPFFTAFGFGDCDISPFDSTRETEDRLQESEIRFTAHALLSNRAMVTLANRQGNRDPASGMLQLAVKEKNTTREVPTTAKTLSYGVVLDNFNHTTGIGEYAVVFKERPSFADTREVRNTVFDYAKELFCSIRSNLSADEVDVVTWQGGFDATKGENYYTFTMTLAAVQPFELTYNNKLQRGFIKARVEGSDLQATMIWAQRNIEALVNRYNRTLSSGETEIPEGGSYVFEREETTSDGYYIFHFKVVN